MTQILEEPTRVEESFAKLVSMTLPPKVSLEYKEPDFFSRYRPDLQFLTGMFGAIRTQFRTDDSDDKHLVETIVATADAYFLTAMEKIQLSSGQITPFEGACYSPDLADFCRANPTAFLGWGLNEGAPTRNSEWTEADVYVYRPWLD